MDRTIGLKIQYLLHLKELQCYCHCHKQCICRKNSPSLLHYFLSTDNPLDSVVKTRRKYSSRMRTAHFSDSRVSRWYTLPPDTLPQDTLPHRYPTPWILYSLLPGTGRNLASEILYPLPHSPVNRHTPVKTLPPSNFAGGQ